MTPPSPPQPAETRARTFAWVMASKIVSEKMDYYLIRPAKDLDCGEPVIALESSTTTEPNLNSKTLSLPFNNVAIIVLPNIHRWRSICEKFGEVFRRFVVRCQIQEIKAHDI